MISAITRLRRRVAAWLVALAEIVELPPDPISCDCYGCAACSGSREVPCSRLARGGFSFCRPCLCPSRGVQ